MLLLVDRQMSVLPVWLIRFGGFLSLGNLCASDSDFFFCVPLADELLRVAWIGSV